jgi:hypothetical protein
MGSFFFLKNVVTFVNLKKLFIFLEVKACRKSKVHPGAVYESPQGE